MPSKSISKTPKKPIKKQTKKPVQKTIEKKKRGTPSKYEPKTHPNIVKALAARGYIDKEIATIIGVTEVTFIAWKRAHPEFLKALMEGKHEPNSQVEQALFSRAIGYTYESEKIVVVSDGQMQGAHVERIPIKEHCPPDVRACTSWLETRDPKRWHRKREVDLTGAVRYSIIPDQALLPEFDSDDDEDIEE